MIALPARSFLTERTMTDLLSDLETPSDAELISRVRGGDVAAYGELFSRHKEAAHRLARQLVRGPDSDDLVSEAFAKVLSVLQGGGGPDVAFRAYLLTAVRRLHVDRVRSTQRLQTTDDMTPFDPGVPFQDTAVAGFESGAAAKAFASLPERWQLVLWHLEVEGQKPADIAPLLGMSANSVSALAYRAREGLRQAFLTMHISDLTETDCRWVNEHLGAFIRKGLSKRDTGKVQSHLDECRRCTAMYLELNEVNSNLAGIIAPLLLGAAASGYLASGGAGAAGLAGVLSKVKELVTANTGAVTAAGVAAGVAAAAAVAVVTLGGSPGHKDAVLADPAASASTPAAAAPSLPTGKTSPSATTSSSASPSASPVTALAPTVPPSPSDVPVAAQSDSPSAADSSTADPVSPTSTVDLSGTTIDDTGVHLVALGSPSLPATLTVRLGSDPSGVVFGASADCTVAADGASAVCSTVSGGSGARVPGAARMAASTSYAADLPFDTAKGPDSADVSVSVDLPDGYQVSGGSGGISPHHYTRPVRVRQVDVALSLSPAPVRPGQDDHYSVTGQLKVSGQSASALSDVTYTVHGGRFDGSGAIATTRPAADGSPSFTVVPDDVTDPAVTISVSVPPSFQDVDGSNDTAAAVLEPYDVRLGEVAPTSSAADADGDQQFTATLDDDGLEGVTYSLSSDDAGDEITSAVPVGDTVTFTVRSASHSSHPVAIAANLPTGYTDADPSNNTRTATWTASPPPSDRDVDVAMAALAPGDARPGPDDTYTLTALVSVDGPGAAELPEITYTIEGGSFVGADCGSATRCTKTATGSPSFVVVPDDPASPSTVSITAVVPTGFHDTEIDNNSATAALRRYDVSLSDLTAAPGTADGQGDQQFTATLDDDGLDGVTFSLGSDDPADRITSVTRVGDTVTFTIRSDSAASHPVSVTAELPTGYTDADAGDNTRTATWTALPPLSRDVDVSMRPVLTPETARPTTDDRYELTAAVSVNGPARTRVEEITYTVTGAQFVDGAETRSTVTRPASDSSPSFVVTHRGGANVTITADAVGFSETAPVDNSARATLRPYDVSLTDLRPTTPTADADGEQVFTATLDRDGYDGSPRIHAQQGPEGPHGDRLLRVDGDTVTFTVHSSRADLQPADIEIRADLPATYTDAVIGNNSATSTYTYYATPTADLKLGLTSDIKGNAGKGSATASVSGVPSGVTATLLVRFEADQVTVSVPAGCTARPARSPAGPRVRTSPQDVRDHPDRPPGPARGTVVPIRFTVTRLPVRESRPGRQPRLGDAHEEVSCRISDGGRARRPPVRSAAMRGRRRVVAGRRSTENRLKC